MRSFISTLGISVAAVLLGSLVAPWLGLLVWMAGVGSVFLAPLLSRRAISPFLEPPAESVAVNRVGVDWRLGVDSGSGWRAVVTEDDFWLVPMRRFDATTLRVYSDRDYVHVSLFKITDAWGGVDDEPVGFEYMCGNDQREFVFLDVCEEPEAVVRALGYEPCRRGEHAQEEIR